jgi:Pentapeptide repeats (8 copies)
MLSWADFSEADLCTANLSGAHLRKAILTGAHLGWANLSNAQFVYLLLHNEKIRDVIDTVGRKGVLLLGRFTEGRIAVLERLRDELRKRGYLPIVFNFDNGDEGLHRDRQTARWAVSVCYC